MCHRRDARRPLVCGPCRDRLPSTLAGIVSRYAALPDVLEPTVGARERVSGTPEPPAPLNLDAEDLMTRVVRQGGIPVDSTRDTLVPATELAPVTVYQAEFDPHTVSHLWYEWTLLERRPVLDEHGQPVLRPAGDQVGYLPVAQVLDQWVRDWIDHRGMGEHRPVPTVPVLADWLTQRLDWACDHYKAMDDFAASLRQVRGWLMNVLGEIDPPPVHCDGIPCKRCDRMELYIVPDGSGDRECRHCGRLYREDEYTDWVRHLAGYEASRRTPEEVEALLRPAPQSDTL